MDRYYNKVLIFSPQGELLHEFGTFGSLEGEFRFPHGICVDSEDNILVADRQNCRIQVFNPQGVHMYTLQLQDQPVQIEVGRQGNIVVSVITKLLVLENS